MLGPLPSPHSNRDFIDGPGQQHPVLQLRQTPLLTSASPEAVISTNRGHKISFKHPGYSDDFGQNIIFTLHAPDHPNGGLHYSTALLGCAIVAGNAWDGYLTESRGGEMLQPGWDGLLLGRSYYFYVPNDRHQGSETSSSSSSEAYRYPVCPSFEHWQFPHDNMPPWWPTTTVAEDLIEDSDPLAPPSASNLTAHILRRDRKCLVTGSKDHIERAHLCPRAELEWFLKNSMSQYNNLTLPGDYLVDDISNAVALRPDLHRAFDDRKFVVIPKLSKWVIHFLESTNDLNRMYHNTNVPLSSGVSPLFMLVRFAWTMFPMIRPFLDVGLPRNLRLVVKRDDRNAEDVRTVRGQELKDINAPDRARSTNPKKPKRKADSDANPADDLGYQCTKRRKFSAESITRTRPSPPSVTEPVLPPHSSWSTLSDGSPTDFGTLKRRWLKAQRPSDPHIICCDYDAAEQAGRLGLEGKYENGGAHLCLECLGAVYAEELPELPDKGLE